MIKYRKMSYRPSRIISLLLLVSSIAVAAGCDALWQDDMKAAKLLVESANADLTEIKKLYNENEGDDEKPGKRVLIKRALEANDAEQVRKVSDDVVYLIADGMDHAKAAIEKIQQAQDLNINDDYKEYLHYKEQALQKQVEAFEQYRQAARALRDNYDPKNEALRAKVKEEFESRSEKYRELMEKGRDFSSQANEIAKEAISRETRQ